jgi:hypothetical protein
MANMYRGDQMAFDASGDLCIAGFIDEDVQCFDTSTGALTQDYHAEILASGLGIEPGGLAFDSYGRLYLSSIFTGQVIKETKKGGPLEVVATVDSPPNLLNADLLLSTADREHSGRRLSGLHQRHGSRLHRRRRAAGFGERSSVGRQLVDLLFDALNGKPEEAAASHAMIVPQTETRDMEDFNETLHAAADSFCPTHQPSPNARN